MKALLVDNRADLFFGSIHNKAALLLEDADIFEVHPIMELGLD